MLLDERKKKRAIYNKEWRISHPSYQKEWRKKHPDHGKQWSIDNKVRHSALKMDWAKRNKDKAVAADIKYKISHRDTLRVRSRKWRENHPEVYQRRKELFPDKIRYFNHRSKATRRSAPGTHRKEHEAELNQIQKGLCYYCGLPFGRVPHLEHKTPLARQGTDWPCNLVLSCVRCNRDKSVRTAEDYIALRGYPPNPIRTAVDEWAKRRKEEHVDGI